jgi:hypothetical protein
VAIPLSGRVPGRASGPSRSRVNDGGGSRCVSGKLIRYLGFSRRGIFTGEGAASGGGQLTGSISYTLVSSGKCIKMPQSVTKHKANGVKTSMEHQKL